MPPPERPASSTRRGPATWAWVGAVALWLFFGIPNLLRNRDEGAAYAIGSFFGGLLGALLLALLVRLLYVQLVAKGRQLWSPWVFVIAAGVLLVVALGRAAEAVQDGTIAGDNIESAAELLVDLSPGLRYASLTTAERQPIEASFRDQVGNPDDIQIRRIVRRDGAEGLVVAVVQDRVGDLEDVEQGLEDSGGTGAVQQIGGAEFLVGQDRPGRSIAFRGRGNALVFILAASPADLRSFARPFANG